jgi:hypothetical protein
MLGQCFAINYLLLLKKKKEKRKDERRFIFISLNYLQMYVEDTSQDTNDANGVVMGMEETTVYTEEVTADHIEPEIITSDIIDESMLQPGTVVHLQQEDETGKIQVIPVMLSLPDLSDAASEVSLATASIMYNN